ncbi:Myosin-1 [Verticillium dahliae VDG2]|nr:Myosin-1 [Verticillium dahliae VDG2]
MFHLKYYAYEGVGGQGGWHDDGTFETEINAQIDCAFANVEKNLKDAGGKGWSQVFRVDSYHVPLDDEAPAAMIRNLAKYMPDHQPIWTCVGVPRLGEEAMKVEIAVVAHDPEGAKTA